MNWSLLLIGLVMLGAGGFTAWTMRNSSFNRELPAGCAMAFGVILAACGAGAVLFSFLSG